MSVVTTVYMFEGRTKSQKAEFVRTVTNAFHEIGGVDPKTVTVLLQELSRENWAEGGTLAADQRPG